MQGRVLLFGVQFTIHSVPGKDTVIKVWVPLQTELTELRSSVSSPAQDRRCELSLILRGTVGIVAQNVYIGKPD
jgi:hypothetical protein